MRGMENASKRSGSALGKLGVGQFLGYGFVGGDSF